jgi:hypothetical protein
VILERALNTNEEMDAWRIFSGKLAQCCWITSKARKVTPQSEWSLAINFRYNRPLEPCSWSYQYHLCMFQLSLTTSPILLFWGFHYGLLQCIQTELRATRLWQYYIYGFVLHLEINKTTLHYITIIISFMILLCGQRESWACCFRKLENIFKPVRLQILRTLL